MRAKLLRLYSPDADPIEAYRPKGPFGILVTAFVQPDGGIGEESFDFVVCTPDWFAARMEGPIVSGRHTLFAETFDYSVLEQFVREYCDGCEGPSWSEVAEKVGRLGKSEFEDYRRHPSSVPPTD